MTPAKISDRVPSVREVIEAIPIDVLRVIYDPDYARGLIKRVSNE